MSKISIQDKGRIFYNQIYFVINPIQTDGWRRGTEIRKRKNDTIDSVLIADLIRYGQFVETRLADEDLFSLRSLTRFRTYLVESISGLKRKVVCVLDQVFPEYQSIFSDIFGKTSKEVLLQFSSPIDFESVSSQTLAELLAKLSRKQVGSAKAEQLKAAESCSFGVTFAKSSFTFQLKALIEQIAFIEKQKLPKSYYQDIQRERNYKKIVIHKNYTPRIMEFVTRKANYKNIEPRQYFEFIMGCLNNPKEIWNDEFFEKLRAEDRIFMTTLYSLTDTSIEEDVIKRAFYYRIGHSTMIDITRNIWEEITRRLEEAFIMIIEKGGRKEIGVINPSVNDFLKSYLQTNMIETENIKQYATEYAQIKRGFADSMEVLIRNGKADEFNYSNQTERLYVILSYICRLGILNKNYECAIECFCEQMPYDYYEGLLARSEIIVTLLSSPFRTFYCIDNYIDESNLIRLFDNMDLNEFETLIVTANLFSVGCFYVDYKDIFIEAVNTSIVDYMENIEADDYYCEYDIDDLLKKNTIFNGYYSEIDQELVVEIICDYIREDVEAEVYEKVKEMPENILQQIRITREYVCINKADIENFIEGYYEPSEPDFDYGEYEGDLEGGGNEIDILDCIFG